MHDDDAVVSAINQRIGAELRVVGRAEYGCLGGAIFVRWPDGSPAVVTRFMGSMSDAGRTAEVLNQLWDQGLPVARQQRVVDLEDGVFLVQQRLRSSPGRRLDSARIDALVEINERFADVLADRPEVPSALRWCAGDAPRRYDLIAAHGPRARRVAEEIRRVLAQGPPETGGDTDLVHVDLSPANVLYDEDDNATAVVDWNLGVYRGNRHLALVQTRFDREWFVRSADADPVETAAAHHLDELLENLIHPDALRSYWAHWLLHHLSKAFGGGYSAAAIDWHLDLAEHRLG